MNTQPLSGQESLNLINEMIERTKTRYEKGAGNPMIYWGAVTVLLCGLFVLLDNHYPHPHWVWFLFLPAAVVSVIWEQCKKKKRKPIVRTKIDAIVKWIGNTMTISMVLYIGICVGLAFTLKMDNLLILFNPGIMIIAGGGMFLTGKTIRQREFTVSGLVFWIGAVLSAAGLFLRIDYWLLIVVPAVMIGGLIIPGIRINQKAKRHV